MYTSHYIGSDRIAGRCLGNTEIRYFYFAVFGNNDILRFDIPVNNMIIMRSLNSHRYLNCNTNSFFYG